MSALPSEQTQQLVKSLELVDEVRNALASTSIQSASAHETAVCSAADLAEAIEQMIQVNGNRFHMDDVDKVAG